MTIRQSPTTAEIQDEIVREMSGLQDRLEKYEYLVDLGRQLRSPNGIRTEEHAVPGCQARVWIRADLTDGRLRLFADSDAMITKGIIALLLRVLDGHPPSEVANVELRFLDETGLRTYLSPARANGLAAMVDHIQSCASAWS